ncbi:hypothetical protein GOZ96_04945 [Agrobacterium vitis]|uniref:Uncharacterized protein n=1 Tax=Agrobacterium vitis TaxID=373 RepID=A0A7J4WX40_AGRVI|nr:zinc-finger-containing protein [Agrobacterium vitis]KAA3518859.1 hypothetical protein DXT89_26685 [Agrobacterium vitis]MUZ95936.1 hypothetical protein [Agrobacterium vitis]
MANKTRKIYCCGCGKDVDARLTNGREIYRHRPDLHSLPFWKCDCCKNYVGCHHKTENRINPLGNIPTPDLKAARQQIHRVLDPIWKSGRFGRSQLYGMVAHALGVDEYHTAEIKNMDEARNVYRIVREIGAAS